MSIHAWPELERPREKLLTMGEAHLSDAELIAIFLRVGVKGLSAVDLARQLLVRFKTIRGLLQAPLEEFKQIHGLGPVKYAQLHAALELGRRYLREQIEKKDVLNNSIATKKFLLSQLRDCHREIFAAIFLNSQNQVICYEELFQGTIDHANVYPREVVERALFHHAAKLIFAHNHPSGNAEPSQADISLTHKLITALALLNMTVLDHFIIGGNEIISLMEIGLLCPS
jgi:DNA repair protein RadC